MVPNDLSVEASCTDLPEQRTWGPLGGAAIQSLELRGVGRATRWQTEVDVGNSVAEVAHITAVQVNVR